MRIKEIKIEGLFEMFEHTVPLRLKERLTIVYGINGIGKTIFFKILDAFFNFKYSILPKMPFEKLIIKCDDNSKFEITNDNKKVVLNFSRPKIKEDISEVLFDLDKKKYRSKDLDYRSKDLDMFIHRIERKYPFRRIDYDKFVYLPTDEVFTIENIMEKYPEYFPFDIRNFNLSKNSKIGKLISSIKLHFIQTQRLMLFSERQIKNAPFEEDSMNRVETTVSKFAKDLSQRIKKIHDKYGELSLSSELSLGERLVQGEVKAEFTIEELKKEFEIVENRRNELKEVGLLPESDDKKFYIPESLDSVKLAVISVNLQDMQSKLKIFDDIYAQLKVFIEILNKRRFSFKKILINKEKGFIFTNDRNKVLSANDLSSGEQHELVLLYDLIFNVPENTVVLIDEPEISLHIKWQKELLQDLEEIIKIRNLDIILATHSPSIINNNWDLTVCLQGINKEE